MFGKVNGKKMYYIWIFISFFKTIIGFKYFVEKNVAPYKGILCSVALNSLIFFIEKNI